MVREKNEERLLIGKIPGTEKFGQLLQTVIAGFILYKRLHALPESLQFIFRPFCQSRVFLQ